MSAMPVCDVCRRIDPGKILDHYSYSISPRGRSQLPIGWDHHSSYRDLRSSAKSCKSCALFFQESIADPKYPQKPPINDDDRVRLFALTGDRWPKQYRARGSSSGSVFLVGLNVDVGPRTTNVTSYHKPLDVWTTDDDPPSLKSKILPRPTGPANDTTVIRDWLTTCLRDHAACKKQPDELGNLFSQLSHQSAAQTLEHLLGSEKKALPTRVIDVGAADGTREPFLLETNGLRAEYLTLSHCWGKGQANKTELSSLPRHKIEIPLSGLCSNFHDAVLVTRGLGFRYLWIDSLCIIQDSEEDWDVESSKMAQIYRNSTLTLSAATAPHADAGFLRPRTPLDEMSARIPYLDSRGTAEGNFYIFKPLSDFDTDVEQGPLNKRGWVLQERILSRRNVFFGQDQFHWECKTTRWSEATRLNEQEFENTLTGISSLQGIFSLGPTDVKKLLEIWYLIVAEYTRRDLTKGNDKLPALSGIVNVFDQALCGQRNSYKAGIWRQDLARGLLWKSFGRKLEHQEKVRAPSWSWISHDGRIQCAKASETSIIAVTDVEFDIELTASDAFGRVNHAKISFTCYIKEVPVISRVGQDIQDGDGKQLYVYTNTILKDDSEQKIGGAYLDAPNAGLDKKIYCVLIRQAGNQSAEIEALLLQEATEEPVSYRRIGVATLSAMGQDSKPVAPFLAFLSTAEKQRITIV